MFVKNNQNFKTPNLSNQLVINFEHDLDFSILLGIINFQVAVAGKFLANQLTILCFITFYLLLYSLKATY